MASPLPIQCVRVYKNWRRPSSISLSYSLIFFRFINDVNTITGGCSNVSSSMSFKFSSHLPHSGRRFFLFDHSASGGRECRQHVRVSTHLEACTCYQLWNHLHLACKKQQHQNIDSRLNLLSQVGADLSLEEMVQLDVPAEVCNVSL